MNTLNTVITDSVITVQGGTGSQESTQLSHFLISTRSITNYNFKTPQACVERRWVFLHVGLCNYLSLLKPSFLLSLSLNASSARYPALILSQTDYVTATSPHTLFSPFLRLSCDGIEQLSRVVWLPLSHSGSLWNLNDCPPPPLLPLTETKVADWRCIFLSARLIH